MAKLKIDKFRIRRLPGNKEIEVTFQFTLTPTATEQRLEIDFDTAFWLDEWDGRYKDAPDIVTYWREVPQWERDDDIQVNLHLGTYTGKTTKTIKKKVPISQLRGEVGNEEYYVQGYCKPCIYADFDNSSHISANLA